jgi:hypothetical protein
MDREARIALEDSRVRELRGLVDSAVLRIMNVPLRRDEAIELVGRVRARALDLFPDRASVFDLVYLPRFARTIDRFVAGPPGARARPDPVT